MFQPFNEAKAVERLRIVTWNINGIRAAPSRLNGSLTLQMMVDAFDADILCFQETKLTRDQLDHNVANIPGYRAFFGFSRVKDGYSGVVTYCRNSLPVLGAEEGLTGLLRPYHKHGGMRIKSKSADAEELWGSVSGNVGPPYDLDTLIVKSSFSHRELEELDSEGRAVMTDHGAFVLFNVYAPNAANQARFDFKRRYLTVLRARCAALRRAGRHVIVAGDLNCVATAADHCDPEHAVREWAREFNVVGGWDGHPILREFNAFIGTRLPDAEITTAENAATVTATAAATTPDHVLYDVFRLQHGARSGAFTCWNQRTFARQTNYGTRLDYIAVSASLAAALVQTDIMPHVHGSDHCPVYADLLRDKLPTPLPESGRDAAALPLCSIALPEFTGKQRSVRDMFHAAVATAAQATATAAQPASSAPAADASPLVADERSSSAPAAAAAAAASSASQPAASVLGKRTSKTKGVGPPPKGQLSLFSFIPAQKQKSAGESTQPAVAPSSPIVLDGDETNGDASLAASLQRNETMEALREAEVNSEQMSQWRGLLGPIAPPICRGHGEPCVRRLSTTKENKGRPFWCCARGKGREGDRDAQCGHFEWADNRRDAKRGRPAEASTRTGLPPGVKRTQTG